MTIQTLYEQDFHSWIQTNVNLLKQSRFSELDVDHLIVELEDMGKKHEHELISRYIILLAHLLKWQFQPTMQCNSWLSTIVEQRAQIEYLLEFMPGLKNKIDEAMEKAWSKAVKVAIKETGLSADIFPTHCIYTQEQLMDEDFYPGNERHSNKN